MMLDKTLAPSALQASILTKLANRLAKTAVPENTSPGTLSPITTPLAIAKCAVMARTMHRPPREAAPTVVPENTSPGTLPPRTTPLAIA
jgi:hypothetical protein